jgi:hypothetical protein
MPKLGKRTIAAREQVDADQLYDPSAAVAPPRWRPKRAPTRSAAMT